MIGGKSQLFDLNAVSIVFRVRRTKLRLNLDLDLYDHIFCKNIIYIYRKYISINKPAVSLPTHLSFKDKNINYIRIFHSVGVDNWVRLAGKVRTGGRGYGRGCDGHSNTSVSLTPKL